MIEKVRKCSICGKEFTYQYPNTRQSYCSEECKLVAKRQQARECGKRKRIKKMYQKGVKQIPHGSLCKHPDCKYHANNSGTCDYAIINKKLRGCPADNCDKYVPKIGV